METRSPSPFVDAAFVVANPSLVLLDARVGRDADSEYARGHLAGARRVRLEGHLSTPGDPSNGGRHPLPTPEEFARTLTELGIRPTSVVVCYDLASGGNAASRACWMLRAVGVEAYVLTGTRAAWTAAALCFTDENAPFAKADEPFPVRPFAAPTADLARVAEARVTDVLFDARSPARFRGDEEPFDPVPGRIPHATNLFHLSLFDADATPLPATDVREAFERAADGRVGERIVACGSGVTACHLALAAVHAGLPMPTLYVGSYSEWCRSGHRIVKGSP